MEISEGDPTCVPDVIYACPNDCTGQNYSNNCWLCEVGKKDPYAVTFNMDGYENCKRADDPDNGYECRYCKKDLKEWRLKHSVIGNSDS